MVIGWQKLVPQAKFDVKFMQLGAIKDQALIHSKGDSKLERESHFLEILFSFSYF
jgi:hypothetical protein